MQIYAENALRTSMGANVTLTTTQVIDALKDSLKHLTIEELTKLKASLVALDKSIYYEIKEKMESPKNKYKVVI